MPLIRFMVRVTATPVNELGDTRWHWPWQGSLTRRILAVNIIVIGLLAGSLFYLDGLRTRLIVERTAQAASETILAAAALSSVARDERVQLIANIGAKSGARFRLFDSGGGLIADSWRQNPPSFSLNNPKEESWQRNVARALDEAVDFVVGANIPPAFTGFGGASGSANGVKLQLAPDRTHILTAQAALGSDANQILIMDRNARDIRRIVRAERSRLGYVILFVTLISVFLSLFLGRTIVQPLRQLAQAATRVRMGRDREVVVPRLPSRVDEIGMLARAVSDMNHALHQRIDATEAFAADVAHELKNPLASLNSAVESLRSVTKPELRAQLQDIISDDVRRLDRLITDISELSRIDARLSRVTFETVDMVALIENIVALRIERRAGGGVVISFTAPKGQKLLVSGEPLQLNRVIENLLDNALSFSPADGTVRITARREADDVIIMVDDDGPGIADSAREAIFERFHSDRPAGEAFGRHSGLGLAIARAIVTGHNGVIIAAPREAGRNGARFIIRLPRNGR
jgi:two-component system, OmpR family, sensor histidine kinase ChvG